MKRRMLLSTLAAIVLAAILTIGGSAESRAQCCSFTVNLSCDPSITPCLPLRLTTNWSGIIQNNPVTCGVTVFPITAFPCPPERTLTWLSFDNGTNQFVVGGGWTLVPAQPGGCCLRVAADLDGFGCVYVKVTRC